MRCVEMITRGEILGLLNHGQLTRQAASERLGISLRQLDRLNARWRKEGPSGLVHRNYGRPSNRTLDEELKAQVLAHTKKHYANCGPTFVKEKLSERHGLQISVEALRLLLKKEGLWKAKQRRRARYHPRRARRPNCGALLQGDGSDHDWFEGRRERCVLLAFIDDATNRAYGRFCERETIEGYVDMLRRYFKRYGRPLALYVDKDSIFRVNREVLSAKATGVTQFGRMMKELGIELICAHSPQAKGRVERLFGTLQDRLVKEMSLRGLETLEEGNEFLEKEFWEYFNKKWNREAANPTDVHREPPPESILERIFTIRDTRKISKSVDFSHEGVLYQVKTKTPHRLVGKQVTIFRGFQGAFWVEADDGQVLEVSTFTGQAQQTVIQDAKTLNSFLSTRKRLSIIERHRKGIKSPS